MTITGAVGRWRRWLPALLAAIGLTACAGGQEYSGLLADPPQPAADVVLTDVNGDTFRLSDLAGQWVLLYFGYTFCPDVCPLSLNNMGLARDRLGAAGERLAVVFVSVDPDRDTPERLQAYTSGLGANAYGVSGTREQIDAAVEAYGARYEIDRSVGTTSAAGYLINHSAFIYVLDPQGRLRLSFPFGIQADAMATDLQRLLAAEQ